MDNSLVSQESQFDQNKSLASQKKKLASVTDKQVTFQNVDQQEDGPGEQPINTEFQSTTGTKELNMSKNSNQAQQQEDELGDLSEDSYDPEPVEEKSSGSDTEDYLNRNDPLGNDQSSDNKLITINSLEDDVKQLQSSTNPEAYYLKQCQRYAQNNLMQIEKHIRPYEFKYEDIKDNVFVGTTFTLDASIQNIRKMFLHSDTKFYNDVIFIKGQQQMVVKTWESFKPQESKLSMSPNIRNKDEDPPFAIKTLRLYDTNNDIITEILTEQIQGDFPSGFYDTSTLFFNDAIYYFKRHATDTKCSSTKNKKKQQQRQFSEEVDVNEGNYENYNTRMYHIYLQLYKYDFNTYQESKIEGYKIQHIDPSRDHDHNYNYIFSKPFGLKIAPKYSVENGETQFLNSQYLILQEYSQRDGQSKDIRFYKLGDLMRQENGGNMVEPFYIERSIIDDPEKMKTQMVLQLYHLFVKSDSDKDQDKEEGERDQRNKNDKVLFIAITEKNHIHFSYEQKDVKDKQTNELKKIEEMDRKAEVFSQEFPFNKHKNPIIHIQKFSIKSKTSGYQDQYFFVDYRNRVSLMYPNQEKKNERFWFIDKISTQGNIQQLDYKDYKKIDCIEDTVFTTVSASNNILQRIRDIKRIIDYDKIEINNILTFCSDKNNQILYITCPNEQPRVDIIFMKDHNSEMMETAALFGLKDPDHMYPQSMEIDDDYKNTLQNARHSRFKQNRKYQTHKMFKKNIVKEYIGKNVYEVLFKEEQQQQTITLDIDTQKVKLSQKSQEQTDPTDPDKKQKKGPELTIIIDKLTRLERQVTAQQKKRPCKIHFLDENNVEQTISAAYVSLDFFLTVELVYAYTNQTDYVFILRIVSKISDIINRSYIFIKKTIEEVKELIEEYKKPQRIRKNLINKVDEPNSVMLLSNEANKYELEQSDLLSIHEMHRKNPNLTVQKLTFEKYINNKKKALNFIPIVFQVMNDKDKNYMLIYSVIQNRIVQKIPINPTKATLKYLYVDDEGFSPFKICRSADLQEIQVEDKGFMSVKQTYYDQVIKLQIFITFNQQVGRIQVQDFLIRQNAQTQEVQVNQVGLKNILFSLRCIETSNWFFVNNSYVVPFIDEDGTILGNQLVLKHDEARNSMINLIDDRYNNLYTYESQILKIGKKKFLVDEDDQSNFFYVISARIRDDVVKLNQFDQSESYIILRGATEIILRMRKPSLEYILMNTFESLKKNDFFSSQEILKGQSICDICLSEPVVIKFALKYYDADKQDIRNSVIHELTKGDRLRQTAFKNIGFYPKSLVIRFDFNFIGTLSRGLSMNSMRSVKLITEYILEDLANMDYYNLMMLELPMLMETQQIDVKNFFKLEEDDDVEKVEDGLEGAEWEEDVIPLSIEKKLEDDRLMTFTPDPMKYLNLHNFENIHQKEVEQEIINQLVERDTLQVNEDKAIPVEDDNRQYFEILHSYIDFKYMIIGQKVRHIKDPEYLKTMIFNDEYFSKLIKEQYSFQKFFSQVSVNKFIDYQFETSKIFIQGLFWFFVIFFLTPYMITLVSEDPQIHKQVFKICLIPQLVLFTIELIQFNEQGLSYFKGFNLIDLTQIILFLNLFYNIVIIEQKDVFYLRFMKLGMIVLSALKTIHFVSAFVEFGFFITMVIVSIIDLIPFLISYITFALFFASMYSAIEANVDEELMSGVGLGKFGRLFLMVWRNSVGKLSFVRYVAWEEKTGFEQTLGIDIVYLVFYVQIVFMLVVMLNFMIAIIDNTYKRVMGAKKMYIYMNKAELNEETYQCLKYFPMFFTLKEYKIIVFSSYKDYEQILDTNLAVDDEDVEEFRDGLMEQVQKENYKRQKVLKSSNELLDNIVKNQRELLNNIDVQSESYTSDIKRKNQEFVKDLYAITSDKVKESVSIDQQSIKSGQVLKKPKRNIIHQQAAVNSSRIVSSRISEQDNDDEQMFQPNPQRLANGNSQVNPSQNRISDQLDPNVRQMRNTVPNPRDPRDSRDPREEEKRGSPQKQRVQQVQSNDQQLLQYNQRMTRTTGAYNTGQGSQIEGSRGGRGPNDQIRRRDGQGYYTFRNEQNQQQ